MIAETANLATAKNVVKEAAAIATLMSPIVIKYSGMIASQLPMFRREQNRVSPCLIERLSGKQLRTADFKLPADRSAE
jgi:hypothetical protein